jgi:Ca-activated chloride channel family protein
MRMMAILLWASLAGAAENTSRSLSPYFAVTDGDADQLPLKSTRVHFDIVGTIADVTVDQTYENKGARPISASYVFPASTRAAVHGMKMTLGERVIEAKIRERQQAKADYEKARAEGKSASLLEEQRPNVFTMNVANILPGDHIDVQLRFTELLIPESGVYELAYPTVVGPRYVGADTPRTSQNKFLASPYLHAGNQPTYSFSLDGTVAAGVPVKDIASTSHHVVSTLAADRTKIVMDDPAGGNRDFILRYRLAGDQIQSGLSLYQGEKENFFLLMVQPPRRPKVEEIPRRDYVFIVDVSGSMHGFPLETAKHLLRDLIGSLRPEDRFNVLLFSGESQLMAPESVPATPENIDHALGVLSDLNGRGGTELLPALERAMSLKAPEKMARSFVVITDGYIAEEKGVFQYVRDHLGKANVFAFGIGTAVNRHLIEGVAHAGLGEPFVVTSSDEAQQAAVRFADYLRSPVLTDVKIKYDGFDAYDLSPTAIPTVFAERPVIVHGKWRGPARGTITLSGESGKGQFLQRIDAANVQPNANNHPLRYLWARARIADLSQLPAAYKDDEQVKAVTALGLEYNLLTEYTSFIAVLDEVRTHTHAQKVDQPLPMPAGVDDNAITGGPEPSFYVMLAALIAIAFFVWRRRFA